MNVKKEAGKWTCCHMSRVSNIIYACTLSEYLIKHLEGLSLSSSLPYLMNSILCVECFTFFL